MDELEAINKIDAVLDFLAIKENIVFKNITDIRKGMSIPESEEIELYLILNKLLKDGYAELFEKEYTDSVYARFTSQPEIVRRYIITFEGRLYKENGGYHATYQERLAQAKRISDDRTRLGELELDQKENRTSMERLTKWIAVAAIISGGYYLLYLLIPILHHFFLK